MNEYELLYIVTPRRATAEVDQVGEWVAAQVTAGGGEVLSSRAWGRRRLAYPINHHTEGTYVLARLRMPAVAAVALEQALHIQEDVIRHMLIRGIMGEDGAPPEYVGERPRFQPRERFDSRGGFDSRGPGPDAPRAEVPAPAEAAPPDDAPAPSEPAAPAEAAVEESPA